MTRREACKVALIFSGTVLLTCGAAIACSTPYSISPPIPVENAGAWKALNVPSGVPKQFAVYLTVAGIGALIAGWYVREP